MVKWVKPRQSLNRTTWPWWVSYCLGPQPSLVLSAILVQKVVAPTFKWVHIVVSTICSKQMQRGIQSLYGVWIDTNKGNRSPLKSHCFISSGCGSPSSLLGCSISLFRLELLRFWKENYAFFIACSFLEYEIDLGLVSHLFYGLISTYVLI